MKLKSLVIFLALALVASVAAPALASGHNPFADVPADHWAYDAVTTLAAVGLVEGYPDGTYGGTRMMTRYEAAMVFARTLARLEALVEAEVAAETAGVREQITADLMAEIEAAKAELTELIYAELANLEIPVVEVEPVEHIIERQPIERPFQMTPEAEAAIAALVAELVKEELAEAKLGVEQVITETTIIERIVEAEDALTTADVERIVQELLSEALTDHAALINRALGQNAEQNQRIEALEGDVAYVEHRVLGLIEGIRGDLDGLEAGLTAEIDALASDMQAMSEEFSRELNLLGVRVDALERAVGVLDGRVDALEDTTAAIAADQDALRADHEDLKTAFERIQFSGDLHFRGSFRDASAPVPNLFNKTWTAGPTTRATGGLDLNIKASESTDVNLWLNFDGSGDYATWSPTTFGVEVLSDTPMHRVVMGRWDADEVRGYMTSYVMDSVDAYGLLGEMKLGPVDAQLALSKDRVGAAFQWGFMDMVGLQASVANDHQAGTSAMMAGLYGDIAMFNYDLKFAMDNYPNDIFRLFDTEDNGDDVARDNWLVDAAVGTEFAGVELGFNYIMAAENFGTVSALSKRPFVLDAASASWQADAGVDILGIDLAGTLYSELGDIDDATGTILTAYNVTAAAGFDLFVPLALSARAAGVNPQTGDAEDNEMYLMGKVGVDEMDVFAGVKLSASYAYHQNWLDGNYKVIGNYTSRDISVVAAGLDYGFDWSGADVALGYNFELAMPMGEATQDDFTNEMTHTLSAKYNFTSDLGLSLTGTRWTQAAGDEADEATTINNVHAGVTFKF